MSQDDPVHNAAIARGLESFDTTHGRVPELAEGLVQCLLLGGITCWNLTGRHVLRHAEEVAATLPERRTT